MTGSARPGASLRQEPPLDQKRDDPRAEEFAQRREAHFGHHMEKSAVHEERIGGERHDDSQTLLEAALSDARRDFSATEFWNLDYSREPIAEILAAFQTGKRLDVHLNLHNEGAIQGVADDRHLVMYCRIENGEVIRPSVRFDSSRGIASRFQTPLPPFEQRVKSVVDEETVAGFRKPGIVHKTGVRS